MTRETEIAKLVSDGYTRDHAVWATDLQLTPRANAELEARANGTVLAGEADRPVIRSADEAEPERTLAEELAPKFKPPAEPVKNTTNGASVKAPTAAYADVIAMFAESPDAAARQWSKARTGQPVRGRKISFDLLSEFTQSLLEWHESQDKSAFGRGKKISTKAVAAFVAATSESKGTE
jgi:hypothetical protein